MSKGRAAENNCTYMKTLFFIILIKALFFIVIIKVLSFKIQYRNFGSYYKKYFVFKCLEIFTLTIKANVFIYIFKVAQIFNAFISQCSIFCILYKENLYFLNVLHK